jgi:hypothetical protein
MLHRGDRMIASAARSAQDESALAVFLRGIERRGFVLAEAQCTDAVLAQAAVIASKAAFHEQAASVPSTQWPSLFWQLLLAQPALLAPSVSDSPDPLSRLDAGPRVALLLRMVAELDQAHGAEVLRVSPATYRHALTGALQRLESHGVRDAQLRVTRDRLRQRIMQAPGIARHLTPVPVAATRELDSTIHGSTTDPHASRLSHWLRPALIRPVLIGLTTLLLVALIATFFWQSAFRRHGSISANGLETLGALTPAATLSPTATAFAGSDFDLLADPQGERVARDLDLYAWYAANSAGHATSQGSPPPLPEASGPETSAPEADASEGGSAQ